MWSTRYTAKTKATPAQVWTLWSDVSGWPSWDHDVEHSYLEGQFENGAIGYLKPKGGPRIKFTLRDIIPMKGFSDRAYLPLTTIDFIHLLHEEDGTLYIEHKVEMRGLLTPFFKHIIGKGIAQGLPQAVERLAHMAERV